MIRIEPHSLWLGNAGDCRDAAKLLDAGIQAVVQLAIEEAPARFTREVICLRIPLNDGSENAEATLRLAIHTVEELLRSNIPTIVCCGGGMSRSPAVAACALARLNHELPEHTLAHLQGHVHTDVSPQLWHDLLACLAD